MKLNVKIILQYTLLTLGLCYDKNVLIEKYWVSVLVYPLLFLVFFIPNDNIIHVVYSIIAFVVGITDIHYIKAPVVDFMRGYLFIYFMFKTNKPLRDKTIRLYEVIGVLMYIVYVLNDIYKELFNDSKYNSFFILGQIPLT